MDRLEIEYKLTQKEVFKHYVEFYKDRITFVRMLKVLPIITGVTWVFLIFSGVIHLSAYILVPMLALLSMPLGFAIMMALIAAKSKKFANGPGYYGKLHKRTITSEGITYPFGKGEVTEKWTDMHKFHESEAFYYFYFTKIEYLLVPKSALKNEDEIEFITKCTQKIKTEGEQ